MINTIYYYNKTYYYLAIKNTPLIAYYRYLIYSYSWDKHFFFYFNQQKTITYRTNT